MNSKDFHTYFYQSGVDEGCASAPHSNSWQALLSVCSDHSEFHRCVRKLSSQWKLQAEDWTSHSRWQAVPRLQTEVQVVSETMVAVFLCICERLLVVCVIIYSRRHTSQQWYYRNSLKIETHPNIEETQVRSISLRFICGVLWRNIYIIRCLRGSQGIFYFGNGWPHLIRGGF